MSDFERNATAAELRLDYEMRRLPLPPADFDSCGGFGYAFRAWRHEIAARQPAEAPGPASSFANWMASDGGRIAIKPPENKGESAGNARFAVMLADMIEEALKARSLGVGNDAIFWRLSERYEAAQRIAPPARSISHWGMFHDAA